MIFVKPYGRSYKEMNLSFYNSIAGDYEFMLEQEPLNSNIRKKVADKFCRTVLPCAVLDFGGGTGLDLPWMADQGYRVFFCEPALEMRKKAIAYKDGFLKDKEIFFLEGTATDFTTWQEANPFDQKIDAILCNFAVLNCIREIKDLFRQLACILKPGGHLIALILHYNLAKIAKSSPLKTFKSIVLRKPFSFIIRYHECEQIVFLHSLNAVMNASGPYFSLLANERLSEYSFDLIHLERK